MNFRLLPKTAPDANAHVSGTAAIDFWPSSDGIHVYLKDLDGAGRQAAWLWI